MTELKEIKTKKTGSTNNITVNSITLVQKLSSFATAEILSANIEIKDYNEIDMDTISKKIDILIEKYPKEVLIAIGFGVKNGGVLDAQTLDRYSGTEALRATVAVLSLHTKTKGVKTPIPKAAITISRLMTFLHPVYIDLIFKWQVPTTTRVEFPVTSYIFKSTFGPYCYNSESDVNKTVYFALLEWNIAHHDKVNPVREGVTRPKFNKTIFNLKIKTSAVSKAARIEFTKKMASDLLTYTPGSTYPEEWARNGMKAVTSNGGTVSV